MRVLIIELQGRGGFWHYANALGRALNQAGAETALATVRGYEILANGVPVHAVDDRIPPSPAAIAGAWRAWNHGRKLVRLRSVLDRFKPQIVHLQDSIGRFDFLYFRWLKARGAKVVYTAHNPRPRAGTSGWLDRARYQSADAIVVLSRAGMDDLIADGVAPSKVSYLPHGNYLQFCQDTISRSEARHSLGLPTTAQVVLFFGGIAPYKGLDILIEAFARLRRQHRDAHLVIVGRPQGALDGYRDLIAYHELTDVVIVKPEYITFAEMPTYFSAANVVALPYRRSYQSGVLQLAYGFSRPVVVSDASDLGEQVSEDQTGVVSSLDPVDFSAALSTVLADEASAAAMGQRGRELAQTKYSWETIARQSLRIYGQVSG
jgi:glycosyltransferase involved in cell wall biosynthesis